MMSDTEQHLAETIQTLEQLDVRQIELAIEIFLEVQRSLGRLFVLGVGGSAANASHAVNDFRKLCEIEAYCPTDNVSELTARVNDEGWPGFFVSWLSGSNLRPNDALLILSVGGGDKERNVSVGLCEAADFARERGVKITAIVGRDGGYVGKLADAKIVIPVINPNKVTPHDDSLQSVICHLFVSDARLQTKNTTW